MQDYNIKIPPGVLKKLLLSIIEFKRQVGDYRDITVVNYKTAVGQFIPWYGDHVDEFDSTRTLIYEWISRSKNYGDNVHNYRVIGTLVKNIYDFVHVFGIQDEFTI